LPPGSESLETVVRDSVGKRFHRGNFAATLTLTSTATNVGLRLNQDALRQVLAAAEEVRRLTGGEPARVEGVLAIRGVLEAVENIETDEQREARNGALVASFEAALGELADARAAEGARLTEVISRQVEDIAVLVAEIAASPARTPDAVRRRLAEQVARLVETGAGLDPARLHQEAVLIATRADVEEELKRLGSHIVAARDLLSAKEPVGRRFDFLAQEFHREANTLCSKSTDAEITRAGLAIKVLVDQMREQVQNIE
jgi:uncharacterized protein (TIGR00255 family)